MASIRARKKADGSASYQAEIVIKSEGRIVHRESATFSRRALAAEWAKRREAEIEAERASGKKPSKAWTVGELIEWYITEQQALTPWGRSKAFDLRRLQRAPIASAVATRITARNLIEHATTRRAEGAGPATVGNDLIWLRQVFRAAASALELPLPLDALTQAGSDLRQRRITAKSRRRERRLMPDEEARLLEWFDRPDNRSAIPMGDIMRFALASARRQEEICRIRWDDLDKTRGVAAIDDVKHPTRKTGNRRTCRLLSDAWAIIERQPRTAPEVFPYNSKTVGSLFTRACRILELKDLRFHDLRHEATSRLFERGYSIQEVSQFTLHESWATLQRYTHLRPEDVPER